MADEAKPEHVKAHIAAFLAKLKALPPLENAPRPLSRRLPVVEISDAVRAEVARREGGLG